MSITAWLVLTVWASLVSGCCGYWKGRLRGFKDGNDFAITQFMNGTGEKLIDIAFRKEMAKRGFDKEISEVKGDCEMKEKQPKPDRVWCKRCSGDGTLTVFMAPGVDEDIDCAECDGTGEVAVRTL